MIVTREEYINALEVIDLYHHQKNLSVGKKTEIHDWIKEHNTSVNSKLYNILLNKYGFEDGVPPFKYVEDITKKEFLRLRGAGMKSLLELESLISKDN